MSEPLQTTSSGAILTADNGVTGAFDSLSGSLNSLFLTAALSYDAADGHLNVLQASDFTAVAQTCNQTAIAGADQAQEQTIEGRFSYRF